MSELKHIGVARRSGRYPWGSGKDPQRSTGFLGSYEKLRDQGLSDEEIVKGLGLKNTSVLRNKIRIEKAADRREDRDLALRLLDKGMSRKAVVERMGLPNESSLRSLLDEETATRSDLPFTIANKLKEEVARAKYVDVGLGVETNLGVNTTTLKAAVFMLEDSKDYKIQYHKFAQGGTVHNTSMKILIANDKTKTDKELWFDVEKNLDKVRAPNFYLENQTEVRSIEAAKSISSKRIKVRYAEEGGVNKDGVIELRRGVEDLSLGSKHYAQVRVLVDGTHFMKGMAIYTDDIPDGVDIIYNTNKERGSTKVFKPIEKDPEHPFGTVTRQKHYTDANGIEQLSPLNIVGTDGHANEEGTWSNWSKSLSSQILSKQRVETAKQQLKEDFSRRQDEFDEIEQLTNAAVKKRLLLSFADGCDTASVDLKAAAMPRQSSHVLLPITSMKEHEVFAPGYDDGEPVVLIRHPHGGTFEIPELIVNNKNKEALSLFGKNALDMVGINPKVAAKLSGADFDGDAVIVIPNKDGEILTRPSLRGLKDFNTVKAYPYYDGMVRMDKKTKGLEMGKASNLITDMTIKGASIDEIERAVKHSMVVIDAEKHGLDWKRSEREQGIPALKKLYQGKTTGGASTLISRAGSEARVMKRKEQVKIDPKTGEKIYAYYTGETYVSPKTGRTIKVTTPNEAEAIAKGGVKYTKWVVNKKGESYIDPKTNRVKYVDRKEVDPVSGKVRYLDRVPQTVTSTTRTTKMAKEKDARVLSSGHLMENAYADHANALKALANKARLSYLAQKETPYSHEANKIYSEEVRSLDAKLYLAKRNKPLERQAQNLMNKNVSLIRQANPDMEPDTLKKIKGDELVKARARVGAKKDPVDFTDREWEAIQSGAISKSKLNELLLNSKLEVIKERAMPRDKPLMSDAKLQRAKGMAKNGESNASIAKALGVSLSTISELLQ